MSRALATALAGLLCSGGLLIALRGMIPRAVPLGSAINSFHSPRRLSFDPSAVNDDVLADVRRQFSPRAHRLLRRAGYDFTRFNQDLRLLRVTDQQFAFWKVSSALACAAAPAALLAIAAAGGFTIRPWWAAIGAIAGIVVGFFLPDLRVKERAGEARDDFMHALAAYLNLTRSLIAAGIHDSGALALAAQHGEGHAFAEIATAIDWANTTGRPPHVGLARLAHDAGLQDLGHVAATLSLANQQGATPTTAFKSASEQITTRMRFAARSEAEAATTKMTFPSALLGAGFFMYLAIPVVWQLLNLTAPA